MVLSPFVPSLSLSVQIFCVHGGIPHPKEGGGYIQAINDIPKNLPDPSEESSLAWDIMWNDPIRFGVYNI